MTKTIQRWELFGISTNPHGVTHFTLISRDAENRDRDYDELVHVLNDKFSAVEVDRLDGPYSVLVYFDVNDLNLGIILEYPEFLDLFARFERDRPLMYSFIPTLLNELNGEKFYPVPIDHNDFKRD